MHKYVVVTVLRRPTSLAHTASTTALVPDGGYCYRYQMQSGLSMCLSMCWSWLWAPIKMPLGSGLTLAHV